MTALTIPPKSTAEGADLQTAASNNATTTTTLPQKTHRVGTSSRGRKAPYPNSILDRRVLQQALEDRGIVVKPMHIEGFYQALHRQHYPDLPVFVQQFEQYNQDAAAQGKKNNNNSNNRNDGESAEQQTNDHLLITSHSAPLKNAVSRKKNRNRVQLPKVLLEFLKDPNNGLVTVTSKVAVERTSADGSTTKLAIQLHDGQQVESVLMRYVSHDGSRASLCVSSQCGCAMGCTFCATGTMGLSGNLTTGEILEQIVHADRILAREWQERRRRQEDVGGGRQLYLDLVRNVGKCRQSWKRTVILKQKSRNGRLAPFDSFSPDMFSAAVASVYGNG